MLHLCYVLVTQERRFSVILLIYYYYYTSKSRQIKPSQSIGKKHDSNQITVIHVPCFFLFEYPWFSTNTGLWCLYCRDLCRFLNEVVDETSQEFKTEMYSQCDTVISGVTVTAWTKESERVSNSIFILRPENHELIFNLIDNKIIIISKISFIILSFLIYSPHTVTVCEQEIKKSAIDLDLIFLPFSHFLPFPCLQYFRMNNYHCFRHAKIKNYCNDFMESSTVYLLRYRGG